MMVMRLCRLAVLAFGFCLLHTSSAQTVNETLFGGQSDDLFCTYSGSEVVEQFEWFLNGQLVWSDEGMAATANPGSFHSYYPVVGVGPGDEGTYSCTVTLVGGASVGPMVIRHLTVLDPGLVVVPAVQEALLAGPASLRCDPAHLAQYRPITLWRTTNDSVVPATFDPVRLDDEGTYICRVYLRTTETSMDYSISFRVIVPPHISSQAPSNTEYTSNEPVTLSVTFQSRFRETTSVTWYKNDATIQLPAAQVNTTNIDEYNTSTSLTFDPITRADRGLYRVVVENSNAVIPAEQRREETSFLVKVEVLPVAPANLAVQLIDSTLTRVTWELTNQTADEGATALRLEVLTDGQTPRIILPPADAAEWNVTTVPGTEYELTLTASNTDGSTSTPPMTFVTAPDAPSVLTVEAVRFNMTSFNISATLSYTGGGDITHFIVSFRDSKEVESEWIEHGAVSSDPSPHTELVWNGVMVNARLAELAMVEFNVTVHNEMNFGTLFSGVQQILLPPGPPGVPTLISSTPTSLTLSLQLSHEGSAPVQSVHLEITPTSSNHGDEATPLATYHTPSPTTTTSTVPVNVTGQFQQGEGVKFGEVGGLEVDTEYRVVAYAVNEAGRGGYSEEATFRTATIPLPISVWLVIVLAVVGSVVVTVLLFLSVLLCCYCCRNQRSHKYSTGSSTESPDSAMKTSTLDSKQETGSVKHTGSFSQITSRPLTPRSPTCSSSHGGGTGGGGGGGGGYQDSPFLKPRFDTSSDSEAGDSETTTSYPRYTYKLSPSPSNKETMLAKSLPILSIPTSHFDDISLEHDHLSPPLTASYATDV